VLLLNASLTTKIGNAGKHMKIWVDYTKSIIEKICKYYYDKNEQLVFMLWGGFAKKYKSIIDEDFHIVLEWLHPSPLAQSVKDKKLKFINCTNFKHANEFLIDDGRDPINWNSINSKYNDAQDILNINPKHHIVFTDGGCHPNNKSKLSRAGYALVFISGGLQDTCVYGNLDVSNINASNIRAEGMAIIRSLELIDADDTPWNKFTIVSDCKFWIDMAEKYMPKWRKSTFAEKSNSDLTIRMWNIYNKVSKKGEVQFMHMKSHNKDGWKNFADGTFEKFCYEQNDYVDKMCNYARSNLQPNNEVTTKVEYE
jgi:uracil DNA glycosylase